MSLGHLGIQKEQCRELRCIARDEFAWEWEGCDEDGYDDESTALGDDGRHRWIGFTTGPNAPIDIKAIESIWRRWERKMNVGSDLRHSGTIFYRSDVDGCVVLRLSPFWVKSSTHRSVVTLLLRMVICYRMAGPRTKTTNQMIADYHQCGGLFRSLSKRFMSGFTKPTYDRWNDEHRKWEEEGQYETSQLTHLIA